MKALDLEGRRHLERVHDVSTNQVTPKIRLDTDP
jgi:hypothetical protein